MERTFCLDVIRIYVRLGVVKACFCSEEPRNPGAVALYGGDLTNHAVAACYNLARNAATRIPPTMTGRPVASMTENYLRDHLTANSNLPF